MKHEPSDLEDVLMPRPKSMDNARQARRHAVRLAASGRIDAATELADRWFAETMSG